MKKILFTLFLLISFPLLNGMGAADAGKQEEKNITIECANGSVVLFENDFEELVKKSGTLNQMAGDLEEPTLAQTKMLPKVTTQTIKEIITLINHLPLYGIKTTAQQKFMLSEQLKQKDITALVELLNTTDYLDIPSLCSILTEHISDLIIQNPSFVDHEAINMIPEPLQSPIAFALLHEIPIWHHSIESAIVEVNLPNQIPSDNLKLIMHSPNGDYFVYSCDQENATYIFNLATQQFIFLKNEFCYSADWSCDNNFLAIGFSNGTFCIWQTENWAQPLHEFKQDNGTLNVSWSPDGKQLACLENHVDEIELHKITIWNTENWTIKHSTMLPCSDDQLSWSPDGKFIACCSRNNNIHILDTNDWQAHATEVNYIAPFAWSPDSDLFACTKNENGNYSIALLKTDDWSETKVLPQGARIRNRSIPISISWSPHGKFFICIDNLNHNSNAGEVLIWTTKDWEQFSIHSGSYLDYATWTHDESLMISGTGNPTSDLLNFEELSHNTMHILKIQLPIEHKYLTIKQARALIKAIKQEPLSDEELIDCAQLPLSIQNKLPIKPSVFLALIAKQHNLLEKQGEQQTDSEKRTATNELDNQSDQKRPKKG
jgi:WD40 repeat protein